MLNDTPDGAAMNWFYMERVLEVDVSERFDNKWTGGGRDAWLQPATRGIDGHRLTRLSEAFPVMKRDMKEKDKEKEVVPDCATSVLEGPPLIFDYLSGVVSTWHELLNPADHYISFAGVAPMVSLAHEYRVLMTALRFMITVDQLNVLNLCGAEYIPDEAGSYAAAGGTAELLSS